MASSATSVPHFDVKQITLAQSKLVRWPASTILEQLQSMALDACNFVYISAIFPCMSWKWPMGFPNWVLVFIQSWVISKADCMIPMGPAARTSLSQSRPVIMTQTPLLISPSTFSSGTSTFQKTSSPVFEPRMPSLSSFWATEKPLQFFSTRKQVMPLSFSSGLVFAYTTITSALGPLVIHIFDPLRMYLLPFFSARSFIAVTSEPAPGSDMARAPTHYPLHSFGRYFCFCASVPCLAICPRQRAVCAPQERPIEPLAREISSMTMEWAVQERSEPPYWEGTVDPRSPISPNYLQRCSGKLSSLSTLWARGAMRSSANLRTVAWRAAVSESKPAIWRKLVVENLRRELVSRRIIILLNRNARHYKRQRKATPGYLGRGGEGVWQTKRR